MQLDIITADKTLFSGSAEVVTLPGTDGLFQVLNNHAPIISSLKKGFVDVKSAEMGNQRFEIPGGIFEFNQNKAVVLG